MELYTGPYDNQPKDSYFRPDTLLIVADLKAAKDKMEDILADSNLHPAARGPLQEAKDAVDRISLKCHHAGNL